MVRPDLSHPDHPLGPTRIDVQAAHYLKAVVAQNDGPVWSEGASHETTRAASTERMERNVAMEKVCYFTVVEGDAAVQRIRYGFVLSVNSQVEVDGERWRMIATRLRDRGYRLVEQAGERDGRPSGVREVPKDRGG